MAAFWVNFMQFLQYVQFWRYLLFKLSYFQRSRSELEANRCDLIDSQIQPIFCYPSKFASNFKLEQSHAFILANVFWAFKLYKCYKH